MAIQFSRKRVVSAVIVLLVLWGAFLGYIWWAMNQPPEKFARVMSKLPTPAAFFVLPFETMWTRARAGHLQIGDPAPDFSLTKQDKSGTVQLAALSPRQPVVLIFGSYT
jgi:hypothetical protein